jgi:peptidyl-prolyl cis-trans isomerase SurA
MTTGRTWSRGRLSGVCRALALSFLLPLGMGETAFAADTTIGPAIQINDEVVTTYELDQRILLMTALNQKGDVAKAARDSLIEDRLRTAAAKMMEATVSNGEVQQGINEFAARGKLDAQQLIQYLASRGVDAESLRDFVRAGMQWREAVRKKFSGNVPVTEAEIDRAIAAGAADGTDIQVSLAEIFLPKDSENGDPSMLAERIIDGTFSKNAFMIFAQKYSKGPTAAGGGLLDWQLMSALPPVVAAAVKDLKPGQISKAVPSDGGITIYYMRDESPAPSDGKPVYNVDYAVMGFAPGQEAAAAALAAKVLTCDVLYPAARGLPEEVLQRQTVPQRALPAPYAGVLARMDPGETRLVPRTDGGTDLVMLCAMIPQTAIPVSRDAVRQQLVNRKLALLAQGWLNQLRSDAIIKDF